MTENKTKILRVEQDVKITDSEQSTLVVMEPVVEKAAGFSDQGLRGFKVIEAPAPVWAFLLSKTPFVLDSDILTDIVVNGWSLSILPAQINTIGWGHYQDMRDTYLSVLN